jgi:trk system potassium uptake protein TrkH
LPLGVGIFIAGFILSYKEPEDKRLSTFEGFAIVAASWFAISLAVAFAFFITGEVGSFVNCFFESVSGFTTTGASVVGDVESLSKSVNALRLFTHWVGGMGILVLVLAVVPKNLDASSMNIFRAEVPGHQVQKFTSRLNLTAKILYLIYTGLTVILALAFIIAKMPVYDSIVHAMSIAGTGGFSVRNGSIGAYNSIPVEIIATVGMFVFGINMNVFYLILIGKFVSAVKSEELRVYVVIYVSAFIAIAACLSLNGVYGDFGTSLRYASFTAASIMSTTGMVTANFAGWPLFCRAVLLVLMLIGGCSGSTAGGIKVSRVVIAAKYTSKQVRLSARPNSVKTIRLEGERLEKSTVNGTLSFILLYVVTIIISFVVLSLCETATASFSPNAGFVEDFSAVVSCMGNVGPAFGALSVGTYADFSTASKLVLCFDMLAGRLEILPVLFVCNPFLWRRAG